MMRVELVGGPEDGRVVDVPNGSRYLRVPRFSAHREVVETMCGERFISDDDTIDLPIERRRDGHVAVWRESAGGSRTH